MEQGKLHSVSVEYLRSTALTAIGIGGNLLCVPIDQVAGVYLASDTQRGADSFNGRGPSIQVRTGRIRVYSLSESLVPTRSPEKGAESGYCVAFSPASETQFALTSDVVKQIPLEHSGSFVVLPDCMRTEHTPVVGLVWYVDKVLLVCTADRLADYLQAMDDRS